MAEVCILDNSKGRATNIPKIRKEDKNNRQEELCLGIILDASPMGGKEYCVYVMSRKDFERVKFTRPREFVALKRVPKVWEYDLNSHHKEHSYKCVDGLYASRLGDIRYVESALGLKITKAYWPKMYMSKRAASKIPFFIEAITTHHLKTQGTTHISTSTNPKVARINQLKQVGLPIDQPVNINEWLLSMGRGIRNHIEKQNIKKGIMYRSF